MKILLEKMTSKSLDSNTYLHADLTYQIIGCAFKAFRIIGPGFKENVYHKIFHSELIANGLFAQNKVVFHLTYQGEQLAQFEIDEIVENKIVVELKSIQTDFIPENYAQIITYLKGRSIKLGLLINFGLQKAFTKRVIFEESRIPNIEKSDRNFSAESNIQKILKEIISSFKRIDQELGPGYLAKIYHAAFRQELKSKRITFDENALIEFGDMGLPHQQIDYWLIQNSFLVGILAGKEHPRVYDIVRMRNYLNRLKLKHGILAFGAQKISNYMESMSYLNFLFFCESSFLWARFKMF
ncbi:GxxExxY protein [candidate division KSB1 bacterium]|nr:GxxExxY protein [candidate division KSB1 bacterium]